MKLIRIAAVPAAAAVLALGVAGPAAAHVTASASETAAGAYTVITFSVPHGCDGSATTEVAISMPEAINAVTPTRNPFWGVEKRMEELNEPITDAHGNELTERVDQVVYTADTPLPDGQRDTFELSLQLPEDATGETLVFPTVQTCEQGETAWTEVAEEGAEEPEHPAPVVAVTDAAEDGHGQGAAEETADTTEVAADTEADAGSDGGDGDGGDGLAVAGLVAGLLGLVLGGVALARTRGRSQA